MKIFAGGIATETNTFSPLITALEDFSVQRARAGRPGQSESGFDLEQMWGARAAECGAQFEQSLMAWAQPAGITLRSAYETLRDELLRDLRRAMPVDIVLLNLHGAMMADGYPDCEADLIRHVRHIVGPTTVVGVELDLHCNLTMARLEGADIVVTYKEYPHTDVSERAAELFDLAVATSRGEIRPVSALFDCRMIGSYPTSHQPLRGLVDDMQAAQSRPGVLSVSFAHGFRSADVPYVGAKVLVVADRDANLACEVAEEFGMRIHAVRAEIGFERLSLPLGTALSRALASDRTPVVVADQSDNPGGGAPGDATFALKWLLDCHAQGVAMAVFHDPQVVRAACKAGEGARLRVRLGGKLGPASGEPVDLEVTVRAVRSDYRHAWPQKSGQPLFFPLGDVAALHADGIDIVVGSRRCQCFSPGIFTDLGIDPTRMRVLVAKSNQHFYAAFAPIAAEIIYMAGPGAVPPDPRQIPYRHLDTSRLFPWSPAPFAVADPHAAPSAR